MADLSITVANVLQASNAIVEHGTTGSGALTAGQAVYKDATSGTWKKADSDDADAHVRAATGIALHNSNPGQPIEVQRGGDLNLGATLTPGVEYYLSNTPGGICPVADVGSGEYVCLIGVATSASNLSLNFKYTAVSN